MAWDSTMRSELEHKSDLEMAHIVYSRFVNGDTKDGIKYSLGGLYVHPIVSHVSVKALKEIRKVNPDAIRPGEGVDYTKLHVKKMGVAREHVIPVVELFDYFDEKRKQWKLTEESILKFMPKLEIALITVEGNDKLKDAHLSCSMPKGWWKSRKRDPFDRYREAGLNDDIWVPEFLTKATAKKKHHSSQKAG